MMTMTTKGKQGVAVAGLLYVLGGCITGLAMANDGGDENAATNPRIPSSCSLVMAPSSIDNGGWGVFSLKDIPRGTHLTEDVVIQVSDLNSTFAQHANKLAYEYGWNGVETGGQYEGKAVMSVSPGIGMLANGSPQSFNVLPKLEPTVDEAEATRHQSPGAGAFSHYHNYSFVSQREIQAGDEIVVNYGPAWFQQRQTEVQGDAAQQERKLQRSKETLLEEGFCLDNILPGQSSIPSAGRGAFASRPLAKGSIVAPVPVLPITKREAMDTTRMRQVGPDETVATTTQQLLLNYCYGHPKSSVLLFPYSPMVNLINHSSKRANVKLQWSSVLVNKQQETLSLEELEKTNTKGESSNLLLELVATRDIEEGEEMLLDYGSAWQAAWDTHEDKWEPYDKQYAPAYVMEEAVPALATQEEAAAGETYPNNLITSCFYPYFHNPDIKSERDITKAEWKPVQGVFEMRNLRPCTIMQRAEQKVEGTENEEPTFTYTVIIRNRYGLLPQERIPVGHMHVVTKVPREAIRFTDKIYTTDQHLPGAFRQEIGLGDAIFPAQWLDLEGK